MLTNFETQKERSQRSHGQRTSNNSRSPIRVLYLIDNLNLRVGGAQAALVGLLRHLDRRRVTPFVCGLRGGQFDREAMRALRIPVTSLKGDWLSVAAGAFSVARLIRRNRIDIVDTRLDGARVIGYVASRLLARGPKLVCHERTPITRDSRTLWVRAPLARRADMIVGVAESVTRSAMQVYGLPKERFATVHNGLELESMDVATPAHLRQELGLPGECSLVGFGGRLVEAKGLTYLLQAIPTVLHEYPATHFVIAGDGPLRPQLRRQAAEAGIARQITFLGLRDDMYSILKTLDVYVQPSLWEGMPMVVIEAMGASLPVVATRVDGIPEVVVDGKTGLLVSERDPMALAGAMHYLLSNPDAAREMGRAGRERIEKHFTWRSVAERLEAVYYGVVNGQ